LALLTADDIGRQSRFAWLCLAALAAMALWFWSLDKASAAMGTLAALAGCLGLILPPRERMAILPWRLRRLPRALDAAPVLGTILTSPGYGLNWFYGVNPFDEVVHLVNGALLGAVFGALLLADGKPRSTWAMALRGLAFGIVLSILWEGFEAATNLIGNWTDTWTDVALTTLGATLAAMASASLPFAAGARDGLPTGTAMGPPA
jgi:hypothetical protein